MASVMPTATYPKTYVINEREFVIRNAAEDTSFQASSRFYTGLTAQTYPKILVLGAHEVKVKNSAEEATARAKYGLS